jgi:hydroxyacylglutathione hydrolase
VSREAPLKVHVMEVGPLAVNAYLVERPEDRRAVVIDPGDEGEAILAVLGERDLSLDKILLTHGHFDHVGGVASLKEKTGAPVHVHAADAALMKAARRHGLMFGLTVPDPPEPDVLVADGELVPFGNLSFRVVHTPGHTPGCVTYIIENMAFVGDLIFQGSIGRTDFPGGDHEALLESVRKSIFVLDDATVLLPGHGPATTVGNEKRYNPFFTGGV